MDKSDYLNEIHRQLSDREVYMPVSHNSLNSIINKIKPIIEHHIGVGTIDKKTGDFLLNSDSITPIFYILPKIHKRLEKPPGHPIVSSTESILSPPAMFLEKILTPLVKTTRSYLKDTNEFITLIKSLGSLPPSSFLVTWDVNSLYTSITHEKGLRATETLMEKAGIRIRNLCSDLLELVLKENYFLFQDTFYVQKQGTAIGSHVAPPYAIAYMASFEEDYIYTHPLYTQYSIAWLRFIDDIFCVWNGPLDTLIQFDHYINNVWPELKFTLQHDIDKMHFLDTLISKDSLETLKIDLYVKPTDRNSILHFDSFHPSTVKRSIPRSQNCRIDRIVSEDTTKADRLTDMTRKFTERGYPDKLITESKSMVGHFEKSNKSDKRIPFVNTYHPYSRKIQTTINKHWGLLSRSYPEIEEFQKPFLPCYRRPRNLKHNLVRADIGSNIKIPRQMFLQTQKQGTFPCLSCLQCNNIQKGGQIFHPQTGRAREGVTGQKDLKKERLIGFSHCRPWSLKDSIEIMTQRFL
ncbi:uncharacterized protein [Dendrobates tinctorius]|uniref:uncharacterized protein isoform X1 n=1 Tax=Dendrobates tinctorius TaxID=92724 RepID=UPI003CC9BC9F